MKKAPEAFRTISEVAEILETPAHVLRFWESKFYQIRPVKRAGGRRYYRPDDVALINGIRGLLQDQGMTIRGVQRVLQEQGVRHVASLGGPLPAFDAGALVDETGADAEDTEADTAIIDDASEAEVETEIEVEAPIAQPPSPQTGTGAEPTAAKPAPITADLDPAGSARGGSDDGSAPVGPIAEQEPPSPPVGSATKPPAVSAVDDPAARGGDTAENAQAIPDPQADAEPALQQAMDPAEEPMTQSDDLAPPVATRPAPGVEPGAPGTTRTVETPVTGKSPKPPVVADDLIALRDDPVANEDEIRYSSERARIARDLRNMPRGSLGARRDPMARLGRRIDALLERMSEASGAGRW